MFTKGEAVAAIDVAIAASLTDAKLPRLTVAEHSALVALRTVAVVLDLREPAEKITELLEDDRLTP